ncbi:hypothetical protein [Mycobacterium sp. TY814]|uniref:hypothetical protein n=1 Tax=unclassified Mycobacterium TaxID=2642494 RepID=UPI002740D962|nr:hypothetical protein [Mycobacterium sp. TY814]MDP7723123.1 hypothetical protein [Mycobacterium sp. TY814]
MKPLTPGYGETPLPRGELSALLPEIIDILDEPITRADVYDLEQGLQDQVFDALMPSALKGLFLRGQRDGDFWPDLTSTWLTVAFYNLITAAASSIRTGQAAPRDFTTMVTESPAGRGLQVGRTDIMGTSLGRRSRVSPFPCVVR